MILTRIILFISFAASAASLPLELRKKGLKPQRSARDYIWFILFTLLSLYLFISFFMLDISSAGRGAGNSNLGGVFGYYISFWAFRLFGYTSFFLPFFLFYSGLGVIVNVKKNFFPLLLSSIILFTAPIIIGNAIPGDASGMIGSSASAFLAKYIGKAGVYIFSVFILAASLLLLWEFSPILEALLKKLSPSDESSEEDVKPKRSRSRKKEQENPIDDNPQAADENANESAGEKGARPKRKEKKIIISTSPENDINYDGIMNDAFKQTFLDFLETPPPSKTVPDGSEIDDNINILQEKLKNFNVDGQVVNVTVGPVITTYEFEPAPGIKVNKITSLSDDLALAMKAKSIRILGHIPGKSAVGIEIPNKNRQTVYMKSLITDPEFLDSSDPTEVILGRDTENAPIFASIASMPHLLIAGTTGSGKSVCINTIITSILFKAQPEEVRFLMVDPKRIELSTYNGVPHLERPVITDSNEAVTMLKELTAWMDLRYRAFAKLGVRDIIEYNKKSEKKKPYIIVIIDEMADLMMTSSKEIETYIIRLAQMSRAVGIHLILATQRPSVNIITGSIKANFPIRISFKVPSKADSKTILDTVGAEKLLGKGDMLFIPPQKGVGVRAHGAFIKTEEATAIANLWAETYMIKLFENMIPDSKKLAALIVENELIQCIANPSNTPGCEYRIAEFVKQYSEELGATSQQLTEILTGTVYHIPIEESGMTRNFRNEGVDGTIDNADLDPIFDAAKDYVIMKGQASTSMLQRHFGIGYPRAARVLEQLEQAGIVGVQNGSKPREILAEDDFKR